MKKAASIILAALLSGAMLVGMSACNNGGDQQSSAGSDQSTTNPFFVNSNSSAQSPAASDTSTAVSDTSDTIPTGESSAVSDVSTIPSASDISVPENEPTESGISDLPTDQSSEPVSFYVSDIDDSDISEDSDDFEDSDDSEDSESEYPKIEPKGTVVAEYVGEWNFVYDFSDMDPEQASLYQSMVESMGITAVLKLDNSGSAVLSVTSNGESSTTEAGSWLADGTSVYVTISGDTAEFIYNNGRLRSDYMEGGYFVRN